MDVAQQREGEARDLVKRVVGEGTVSADREKDGAPLLELVSGLAQALELGRSDAAPVEAVERENDVGLALPLLERDRTAERGGQREGRRRLAPFEGVHAVSLA